MTELPYIVLLVLSCVVSYGVGACHFGRHRYLSGYRFGFDVAMRQVEVERKSHQRLREALKQ